jgi:aspartate kinase
MLIVKKYGGSSVSTPEKILEIAKKLKSLSEQGHKLIVIVSAMGDTTDDLVQLSRRITHTPIQREMDMLLSAGERISMALMSMALNSLGCEAISFTGSQSGVFTDESHNNARIKSIKAFRVKEEIDRGRVVIIAGFQGVNPETKEITTLGRGGSDTTAVAMAAHFNADRCDILTDVRGIYSVDPRLPGVTPLHFAKLDYAITMEMAYWGARVLHYRSVELAERSQVPLAVHLSSEEGLGTLIDSMEETQITAVNYNSQLACIHFGKDLQFSECMSALNKSLQLGKMPAPQIVHERSSNSGREFFVSAPQEHFENIQKHLNEWAITNKKAKPMVTNNFGTVTLTGRGLVNSNCPFKAAQTLNDNTIETDGIIVTPLSISFLVPNRQVQKAAQILHEFFVQ